MREIVTEVSGNPDVATFDRINSDFAPMRPRDKVIVQVIAAIIAEELRKEAD